MSRNARTSVPRHNYTAPALRWTNSDSHMRVLTTRAALPNNFSFAATRTLHRLAKKYPVLLSRHCEPCAESYTDLCDWIARRRGKFADRHSTSTVDNACVTCGIFVEDCERIFVSPTADVRLHRVFLGSHNPPLAHNARFSAKTKPAKSFPPFHNDHHNNKGLIYFLIQNILS